MIFFAICPKENSNKPTICPFQTQKRKHFRWLFVKERGKIWKNTKPYVLDIYDVKWRIPAVKEKKSSCYIEEIQHVPVYGQKEVIDADRDQIPGKQRNQINKTSQAIWFNCFATVLSFALHLHGIDFNLVCEL